MKPASKASQPVWIASTLEHENNAIEYIHIYIFEDWSNNDHAMCNQIEGMRMPCLLQTFLWLYEKTYIAPS